LTPRRIAHGWVFSKTPKFPVKILRFAKPSGGRVTIENVTVADEAWFQDPVRFLYAPIARVDEATRLLVAAARS